MNSKQEGFYMEDKKYGMLSRCAYGMADIYAMPFR